VGHEQHTVNLWDLAGGKKAVSLTGHTGRVLFVAFTADGKTLVTGDGTVKLWDVAAAPDKKGK
jgi:WD40 repeat protein